MTDFGKLFPTRSCKCTLPVWENQSNSLCLQRQWLSWNNYCMWWGKGSQQWLSFALSALQNLLHPFTVHLFLIFSDLPVYTTSHFPLFSLPTFMNSLFIAGATEIFFFFLNIYSICLVGWCIYLKSELCSTMAKKYPVSRFILLIGEVMRISLMCRVTEHQGSGSVFQFIAFAFLYRETAPVVDFPLSLAIISQKPLLLL